MFFFLFSSRKTVVFNLVSWIQDTSWLKYKFELLHNESISRNLCLRGICPNINLHREYVTYVSFFSFFSRYIPRHVGYRCNNDFVTIEFLMSRANTLFLCHMLLHRKEVCPRRASITSTPRMTRLACFCVRETSETKLFSSAVSREQVYKDGQNSNPEIP